MELDEEVTINAPRDKVFAALLDPEVLAQAIPGCESMEKTAHGEYRAAIHSKVGPLAAKFTGAVTLEDIKPPESYIMVGEGKAGPAGFAKIRANINLEPDGAATTMRYTVHADIGGKLGQLGGPVIEGTASKLATTFFQRLEGAIGAVTEKPERGHATTESPPLPAPRRRPFGWFTVAGIVVAIILYIMQR